MRPELRHTSTATLATLARLHCLPHKCDSWINKVSSLENVFGQLENIFGQGALFLDHIPASRHQTTAGLCGYY